ncbi:MAG: hypothetical protein HYR74_10235 [Candidatus Eisenbacteria bacterium]|nr:hypothetical protein [Candidatus Eisenbacteria bacterium]
MPLVLHSRGGALGEPAADDWDFITYARAGRFSFWDGGGSSAFWRPLPHQIYYGLISPLLPAHAWVVPVVHGAMLVVIALLIFRAARLRLPDGWAAAVATFPLFAEAARMALQWPCLSVELSFLLFTALALHEAAFDRLPTALLALLAALLSKEVAVVTALALPWLPRASAAPGAGARRAIASARLRWIAATAVVTLVWAAAYIVIRRAHGYHLPHGFETERATIGMPWPVRYGWAVANASRVAFSLPVEHARLAPVAIGTLALLLGAAAWTYARDDAARRRLAALAPVAIAGVVWFATTLAPLVVVYPMWMPHRALVASLGLGLALVVVLGAARPALIAALVVARLALFAASPALPARVTMSAPETGAFLDAVKLARLQRLMRDTRLALAARFPALPHGARVAMLHPPISTEYAFGGSQAIDVWYRDPTLRWARYDDLRIHPDWTPAAVVDFEANETPQIRFVAPEAMRHYIAGEALTVRDDWDACLRAMARADSAQADSGARAFVSRVAGRRAFALLRLGRSNEAEREALRSLALWSDCSDARFTLASSFAVAGRHREANLELDTLFSLYPNDRSGRALRDTIAAWERRGR